MYLQVAHVSKSYGYHSVLHDVSLVLNAGERVGLVGANGVGKSTLLKIIAGVVQADSGSAALSPGMKIGYLPQIITGADTQTVDDMLAGAMRHLTDLENQMRALEMAMTQPDSDVNAVMAEYGEISEAFERYGGYEIDYRIELILSGLGIPHIPREQRFGTLSGGEKARLGLALLLLGASDVLLLDEPTNHLDSFSLTWLEAYVVAYRGGMLIVSHDREFLNRTVNAIIEIDEHTRTAKRYSGDYDTYQAAKIRERAKWEADYAAQQAEIEALTLAVKETSRQNRNYRTHTDSDKFVRNDKIAAHAATVSRNIRAAEEKLARILENPISQPPASLRFDPAFDPAALKGRLPLIASGLTKFYGERAVLCDVSLAVAARARIALVGPNGAGKSTLLKILIGLEKPDSGSVQINPAVRIGYLAQDSGLFDPAQTAFAAFRAGLELPDQALITILIRSGLFRYDDLNKRVGELSSGQGRKLQIARLIADGANLLALDEPTNDVSFDVLEALEDALRYFPGPVIAASHDRRFLQQFGGEVWEVSDGKLQPSEFRAVNSG